MKKFFENYEDWILIALAAVFVGVIIYLFSWGISLIAENVGTAIAPPSVGRLNVHFNLDGARALNLPQ